MGHYLARAADWLQRAADQGLAHGEAVLGVLFLRGAGASPGDADAGVTASADAIHVDVDRGMALLQRAAAHGSEEARRVVAVAEGRATSFEGAR